MPYDWVATHRVAKTVGFWWHLAWLKISPDAMLKIARLEPEDEIMGGDIYYFGPIDFVGDLASYDVGLFYWQFRVQATRI